MYVCTRQTRGRLAALFLVCMHAWKHRISLWCMHMCMHEEPEMRANTCVQRMLMCACIRNKEQNQTYVRVMYSCTKNEERKHNYVCACVHAWRNTYENKHMCVCRVFKCTCMQGWLRPPWIHVCMYQDQGMKTKVCAHSAFMCACMKNQEWKQTHVWCVCMCAWMQSWLPCIHVFMCASMRTKEREQTCVGVIYWRVHVWEPRNDNKVCIPKAGCSTPCLHVCMYATHTMHAHVKHSERCSRRLSALWWLGLAQQARLRLSAGVVNYCVPHMLLEATRMF
jgi:hypothetical protein